MSKQDNCEVPESIFHPLNKYFQFDLDVAADYLNRKCELYIDKEANGAVVPWPDSAVIWCHPPLSYIETFIKKAAESKAIVVALVPARYDGRWWQNYVADKADHIIFLNKRIRWKNGEYSWEPYVILIYRGKLPEVCRQMGMVVSKAN